jgi:hypothetical protein
MITSPESGALTGMTIFAMHILLPVVYLDVHHAMTWVGMRIGSGIGYSIPRITP